MRVLGLSTRPLFALIPHHDDQSEQGMRGGNAFARSRPQTCSRRQRPALWRPPRPRRGIRREPASRSPSATASAASRQTVGPNVRAARARGEEPRRRCRGIDDVKPADSGDAPLLARAVQPRRDPGDGRRDVKRPNSRSARRSSGQPARIESFRAAGAATPPARAARAQRRRLASARSGCASSRLRRRLASGRRSCSRSRARDRSEPASPTRSAGRIPPPGVARRRCRASTEAPARPRPSSGEPNHFVADAVTLVRGTRGFSDCADARFMRGEYLAASRSEMIEAVEQSPVAEEDDHGLRSLAALTEAFTELEARVTRVETGSHCNICCAHESVQDAPAAAAA